MRLGLLALRDALAGNGVRIDADGIRLPMTGGGHPCHWVATTSVTSPPASCSALSIHGRWTLSGTSRDLSGPPRRARAAHRLVPYLMNRWNGQATDSLAGRIIAAVAAEASPSAALPESGPGCATCAVVERRRAPRSSGDSTAAAWAGLGIAAVLAVVVLGVWNVQLQASNQELAALPARRGRGHRRRLSTGRPAGGPRRVLAELACGGHRRRQAGRNGRHCDAQAGADERLPGLRGLARRRERRTRADRRLPGRRERLRNPRRDERDAITRRGRRTDTGARTRRDDPDIAADRQRCRPVRPG